MAICKSWPDCDIRGQAGGAELGGGKKLAFFHTFGMAGLMRMLMRQIGVIFLKIQSAIVANTLFCRPKPISSNNFEKNTPICCLILKNQPVGQKGDLNQQIRKED